MPISGINIGLTLILISNRTVSQGSQVGHCAVSMTLAWMDGSSPSGVEGAGSALINLLSINQSINQ